MTAEFCHFYDDCPSGRGYDCLVYDPLDVSCYVCTDRMFDEGILVIDDDSGGFRVDTK